jgi:hypothetical protein
MVLLLGADILSSDEDSTYHLPTRDSRIHMRFPSINPFLG